MPAVSQGREPLVLQLLTSGWVQYALALIFVPIDALERAGFWVPLSGFLVFLALLGFLPIQIAIVVWRWRHSSWRALAPLVAIVLVLLSGHRAGARVGDELLRYRFESNRTTYDAVAEQVLRGTYPKSLRPEHQHLAYWARTLSVPENDASGGPLGVSFLVVSHGFAGHVGFIRLADPSTANRLLKAPPPGWSTWLGRLDGQWYLVAN
ncbi:MAG: hypothetical protein ACOY0T_18860 [Myxococcota bacterium]